MEHSNRGDGSSSAAHQTSKQQWDAELYDDKHSFVWKYGAALLDLLAAQPGERVLDLGCRTGHLTERIASRTGNAIGLDQSSAMIEQARRDYPHLHFVQGDARDFDFAEPFDAVFSNATLHWISEPERVISCVRRTLRPGGRFVAEFGGKGNVQILHAGLTNAARTVAGITWTPTLYFPSIGEYTSLLERGGVEVTYAYLFDRPTPLEGEQGMRGWITMFDNELLSRFAGEQREHFLCQAEAELRPLLYREGRWFADYRRLRIVAQRRET